RISLGRAFELTSPVLRLLADVPGVEWAVPTGSLRRGQETVGDIEIVTAARDPAGAIEQLMGMPDVLRCLLRGERRIYLQLERIQVGIRLPELERAAAVLLHSTGSVAHVAALRSRAAQNGWRLSPDGLYDASGALHPTPTEEHLYAMLGLQLIPPEI